MAGLSIFSAPSAYALFDPLLSPTQDYVIALNEAVVRSAPRSTDRPPALVPAES